MKKSLSLMLALAMLVAVVAVPVTALASEGYTSLPYKTESFARFRNGLTAVAEANLRLSNKMAVGIDADRFPLYGDSALVGAYSDAEGKMVYTTEDLNNVALDVAKADVAIIADEFTQYGTTVNHDEKTLHVPAPTDTYRAIGFGFVPNEILSQVEGIYYKWQERAVTTGTEAKVIVQWIDANGIVVEDGSVVTVDHTATIAADGYTEMNVVVENGSVTYNDTPVDATGLDLSNAPEGAVGIKLLVSFKGEADRYYKNLEVGTISNNMAAFAGDNMFYNSAATTAVINFAAPVTAGAADVKLYKGGVPDESATYAWNGTNTQLTITKSATFGESNGYRVSTSKASTAAGQIINDVTFNTYLKTNTTEAPAITGVDVYDLKGNKLNATAVVDSSNGTNTIEITIWTEENQTLGEAIVPAFNVASNADKFTYVYYNHDASATFAVESRGAYVIYNGATAIPLKDFSITLGSNTNASKRKVYAVTVKTDEIPANRQVSSEIAAAEGEDISAVNVSSPVTVTFSHPIAEDAVVSLNETVEGTTEPFAAFETEWSEDKQTLTISPALRWTLGAEYAISLPADASVFGDQCALITDGLGFTVSNEQAATAILRELAIVAEDTELPVMLEVAEDSKVVSVAVFDDSIDLSEAEFTAKLSSSKAYVQIGDSYFDSALDNFEVGGTIDISDANGLANAIDLVVNNGTGQTVTYSLYTFHADEVADIEVTMGYDQFDDLNVDDEALNLDAIKWAGRSAGEISATSGNTTDYNAKIALDPTNAGNKVLRMYAGKPYGGADGGGYYVAYSTKPISKDVLKNYEYLIYEFDMYINPAKNGFNDSRFHFKSVEEDGTGWTGGTGFQNSALCYPLALGGNYNHVRWWQNVSADDYYTIANSSINTGTWYTYQYKFSSVADDPETFDVNETGTNLVISKKVKGATEWESSVDAGTSVWDMLGDTVDHVTLMPYVSNAEYFLDNYRIYCFGKDIIPEVSTIGKFVEIDEPIVVNFKSAINLAELGGMVLKKGLQEVPATFEWDESKTVLTITPENDLLYGTDYTIEGTDVVDIFHNPIPADITVTTVPSEDFVTYEEVEVEYTGLDDGKMASDSTATVQLVGDETDYISTEWYDVTVIEGADIIEVVENAADSSWTINPLVKGTAKIQITSRFYDIEIVKDIAVDYVEYEAVTLSFGDAEHAGSKVYLDSEEVAYISFYGENEGEDPVLLTPDWFEVEIFDGADYIEIAEDADANAWKVTAKALGVAEIIISSDYYTPNITESKVYVDYVRCTTTDINYGTLELIDGDIYMATDDEGEIKLLGTTLGGDPVEITTDWFAVEVVEGNDIVTVTENAANNAWKITAEKFGVAEIKIVSAHYNKNITKTVCVDYVDYDAVEVDWASAEDTVLGLEETTEVKLIGSMEGEEDEALASEWFAVESANEDIVKVNKVATGYEITGKATGWTHLTFKSAYYDGVDETIIVYVNREPVTDDADMEDDTAEFEITIPVIEGDYNQALATIFKATTERNLTVIVSYSYVKGTVEKKVNKTLTFGDIDPDKYQEFVLEIPEEIVEAGSENVVIKVKLSDASAEIAGIYKIPGIDIEAINHATTDNAFQLLKDVFASMKSSNAFTNLTEAEVEDLEEALLEKIADEPFGTKADIIEWVNEQYEDIIGERIEPDGEGEGDGDSDGGSNGSGTKYPTTFVPSASDIALNTNVFTDLGSASWAKTAINTLYAAGIVNGTSATTYDPLGNVTREQFVKLLTVAFGIYDPFLDSHFADVNENDWFNAYVASATQAGIVAGISETEFGAGQYITREQMATMLKRACDKYGVNLSGTGNTYFTDSASVSGYAADAVESLAKAGVINGIDGAFVPQLTANRAMAAQVIYLVWLKF